MREKISLEEAYACIRESIKPLAAQWIPAVGVHRRVLAEDVKAPMDQPPFPRSPLDGFALRAADTAGAGRERPVRLEILETLYAGSWPSKVLKPGQAVEVMTGAPIPPGCDCVVRQEDTRREGDCVELFGELHRWENYCFQGEDYRKGEILLPAGTRLDAAGMGVLAGAGLHCPGVSLPVRRIPRVVLLTTGDELVHGDTHPLPPGKIYSSNHAYIETRLKELGMEVIAPSDRWPDQPQTVAEGVRRLAEEADAIITTGGVSVGAKDIFHQVLPLLGAERLFWRVLLKPGTPLMYALFEGKPMLCLSGNPFAAAATFELLGRVMLSRLGDDPGLLPLETQGRLLNDFPKKSGVRRFLRGSFQNGEVGLPEGHSSGQFRSTAGTNCLVELEAGSGPALAGDAVRVHLL